MCIVQCVYISVYLGVSLCVYLCVSLCVSGDGCLSAVTSNANPRLNPYQRVETGANVGLTRMFYMCVAHITKLISGHVGAVGVDRVLAAWV